MARNRPKDFQRAVQNWTHDVAERSHRVQRDAVHGFVETLQDNMPEETGNLRRSVVVSDQPFQYGHLPDDTKFTDRSAENRAKIEAMPPDGTLYIGVQAPYSAKDNYGAVGSDGKVRPGKFWADRSASAWRGLVARYARAKGMRAR